VQLTTASDAKRMLSRQSQPTRFVDVSFRARVQAIRGRAPHDYLVLCRVRRVQELLCTSEMSLGAIARAAGFSGQSHCTRRFREHTGLTPSPVSVVHPLKQVW